MILGYFRFLSYGWGTATGTGTLTSRLISTGNGFEYGTLTGTGI